MHPRLQRAVCITRRSLKRERPVWAHCSRYRSLFAASEALQTIADDTRIGNVAHSVRAIVVCRYTFSSAAESAAQDSQVQHVHSKDALAEALKLRNVDESMTRLLALMRHNADLFKANPDYAIPEGEFETCFSVTDTHVAQHAPLHLLMLCMCL